METCNPGVKLFDILKRADSKNMGVAPEDRIVFELQQSGIIFKPRDKEILMKNLPRDRLNNVDYVRLNEIIYNKSSIACEAKDSTDYFDHGTPGGGLRAPPSNLASAFKDPLNPRKSLYNDKNQRGSKFDIQKDKDADLLRNRVNTLESEIKRQERQVAIWKEKATKNEQESFDRANRGGSHFPKDSQSNLPPPPYGNSRIERSDLMSQGEDGIKGTKEGQRMVKEMEEKLNQTMAEKDHLEKVKNLEIINLKDTLNSFIYQTKGQ